MADMRACSAPGCDRPARYRAPELCVTHYKRMARRGSFDIPGAARGEPQRFFESALKYEGDDCLFWPFSRTAPGYAQININNRPRSVSREICKCIHGAPPLGKNEAAHSCGNGHLGCVNPAHMRWATKRENAHDRIAHGTANRGERCNFNKIDRDAVLAIRALQGTKSQRAIAEQFGISAGHVSEILARKTWSWLPEAANATDREAA